MTVSTIANSRSYLTRQLTEMNELLAQKTTQLATGKVGNTYGDIGDRRLLDIELTQKVSMIDTYKETITVANLHLEMMNLSLERLEEIRRDTKSAIDSNSFVIQNDGQTQTQSTAEVLLYEVVNLLNTEVAGFYLYGGTDAVRDPVAKVDEILNGANGLDGLATYMDEYAQANLGAGNTGRMDVSALTTNYAAGVPTDSTFTITEDGAHGFGFDISSVTSGLSNTVLTGPSGGDPDTFDVQLTGQPVLGEKISINLTLPPAHTETLTIELTAAENAELEGTFAIGADLEETAQNLRDAVAAEFQEQAQTTLRSVSDNWAADEFFGTYNGEVPTRVDGPPFTTATAQIAGGATTLEWYTGENTSTTDPRTDKTAVADTNLSVNYGVRGNEAGLTDLLKSLATFVAADFSGGTAIDQQYYNTLSRDLRDILEPDTADQSGIVDISTDISIAHRTLAMTDERHTQMKSSFEVTIGEIEGVDNELLAAEILQLQTNIQASYNASSIVFNLSLADYL